MAPTRPKRTRKQRNDPDAATTSEVDAATASPPPSVSEDDANGERGQPSNGNTSGQARQASSSLRKDAEARKQLTAEQPSALNPRDVAVCRAQEQTVAEAAAIGVDEQPTTVAGFSAIAQGKQPAIPSRPAIVTQADPSREREMIGQSTLRAETTAHVAAQTNSPQATAQSGMATASGGSVPEEQQQVRVPETGSVGAALGTDAESSQAPPLEDPAQETTVPLDPVQEAISSCRISYRSDIASNGASFDCVTIESSIFHMSLDDVVERLGLGRDFGTLHIRFDVLMYSSFPYEVSNQDDFQGFRDECLSWITNSYRRGSSRPNYMILFSRANITPPK